MCGGLRCCVFVCILHIFNDKRADILENFICQKFSLIEFNWNLTEKYFINPNDFTARKINKTDEPLVFANFVTEF